MENYNITQQQEIFAQRRKALRERIKANKQVFFAEYTAKCAKLEQELDKEMMSIAREQDAFMNEYRQKKIEELRELNGQEVQK